MTSSTRAVLFATILLALSGVSLGQTAEGRSPGASATNYHVLPRSEDQALKVRMVGPSGGDVRSLVVHPQRPDRFFLGTADGQIFVSDDAGERWSPLVPGLGRRNLVVDNLHFDPRDPDTLYAGGWETRNSLGWLYKTTDAGRTWDEIPLGENNSSVRAVALSPADPDVIALGISEGVIITRDQGLNWTRITRGYRSLYNVESLAFDPIDSETLYVGTWRLGWKTTNLGKNWTPIHKGMAFDSDVFSLLVSPTNPSTLFSSACTGIYKSVDGGAQWTKLRNGLPKEAKRTRFLHFDPSDTDTVYAGTTVGLYKTSDSGMRWERLLKDVVVNAIAVHPSDPGTVLIGTDDAGVLRSRRAGLDFTASNNGFTARQVNRLASSADAQTYYAAVNADGRFGGFYFSRDQGENWEIFNRGLPENPPGIESILTSLTPGSVFLKTSKGIFRGRPGEVDWARLELREGVEVDDVVVDETERYLFFTNKDGLFRFDLQRRSLKQLGIDIYNGPFFSLLHAPAKQATFVGTEMGVFRSDDSGRNWAIRVKGLPYTSVNMLASGIEGPLFGLTPNGLYISSDWGENWTHASEFGSISLAEIKANPMKPSEVFGVDDDLGRVHSSRDGGKSWSVLDLGPKRSQVLTVHVTAFGSLLAGTVSDGLYLVTSTDNAAGGR